jgi:hypothetical protein
LPIALVGECICAVAPATTASSRAACGSRHNMRAREGLSIIHATGRRDPKLKPLEAFMDYASSNNAFNVLFILTFFASLAITMFRFG